MKKTPDGGQPTEKIRGNTRLKKAKNRKNAHVHKPGTAGWSAHRHEKTVKNVAFVQSQRRRQIICVVAGLPALCTPEVRSGKGSGCNRLFSIKEAVEPSVLAGEKKKVHMCTSATPCSFLSFSFLSASGDSHCSCVVTPAGT